MTNYQDSVHFKSYILYYYYRTAMKQNNRSDNQAKNDVVDGVNICFFLINRWC